MKILHLATRDTGRAGGGFDASYRLHKSMRNAGLDSRMLVLHKASDDPDVIGVDSSLPGERKILQSWSAIRRRVRRRIFRVSPYFHFERHNLTDPQRLVDTLPVSPDVIIAHWISGFVNAATLRDLGAITNAPILWYLMDMAAFTGGCHYAFGCDRYTLNCGHCPQLGVWRRSRDASYRQLQSRRLCLEHTNITAVAASSWLRDQVASSSVFRDKRIETIFLGIDTSVFHPGDRNTARTQLNIPDDRKVIYFGAQNLDEDRKGFRYLSGALKLLFTMLGDNVSLREKIIVVTAGHVKKPENLEVKFEHQHIGFLKGDARLAAGYQAADIYVNASIEDSGPMMINESLLCGTPVVSFEMGVALDLVLSGKTGYRARLKDEQELANGLLKIIEMDSNEYDKMRDRCRSHGLKFCHPDVQVEAFLTLCQDLTTYRGALEKKKCL